VLEIDIYKEFMVQDFVMKCAAAKVISFACQATLPNGESNA